jgi:hypothetical protein
LPAADLEYGRDPLLLDNGSIKNARLAKVKLSAASRDQRCSKRRAKGLNNAGLRCARQAIPFSSCWRFKRTIMLEASACALRWKVETPGVPSRDTVYEAESAPCLR